MEKELSTESNKFRQYYVTIIANLGGFLLGLAIGWSSPATETLEAYTQLSIVGISWISGSLGIGAAFSVFPVTFLADEYGRKTVMFWCAPPLMVGWLVISLGETIPILVLGRIITGFFSMSYNVTARLYLKETIEKDYQLRVHKIFPILIEIGVLVSFTLGLLNDVFILSIFPSTVSLLFAILIYTIPETPVFLLKNRKINEAEKSLQWLRGKRFNISEELTLMEHLANEVLIGENTTLSSAFELKATRKAIWISIGLIFCQQMSGISIITYFSVLIFQATNNVKGATINSIILASVQVVAMMVAVLLIGKLKNVTALIISFYIMGFSLFAIGTLIAISQHNEAPIIKWVVLAWCCLYITAYTVGCALVVPLIIKNFFPDKFKRDALTLTDCINYLLTALITQSFYYMQKTIGLDWVIWFYAVFCFLATAFIFIFVFRKESVIQEQIRNELENINTESFLEEEVTFM